MQTSPDTPDLSGALDTFEITMERVRTLNHLVYEAIWNENLDKGHADSIAALFDQQLRQLDAVCETLRGMSGTLTAHQTDNEDLIRRIRMELLREPARRKDAFGNPLPNSAERAELRRVNIRLILADTDYSLVAERYALPQETIRDILIAMIDAPQKVPTPTFQDMPVKPVNFPPFEDDKEVDDEERQQRIARTIDRMRGGKHPDDGDDAPGKTGTDDE